MEFAIHGVFHHFHAFCVETMRRIKIRIETKFSLKLSFTFKKCFMLIYGEAHYYPRIIIYSNIVLFTLLFLKAPMSRRDLNVVLLERQDPRLS